jgi:hypothetical protein
MNFGEGIRLGGEILYPCGLEINGGTIQAVLSQISLEY